MYSQHWLCRIRLYSMSGYVQINVQVVILSLLFSILFDSGCAQCVYLHNCNIFPLKTSSLLNDHKAHTH